MRCELEEHRKQLRGPIQTPNVKQTFHHCQKHQLEPETTGVHFVIYHVNKASVFLLPDFAGKGEHTEDGRSLLPIVKVIVPIHFAC